GQVLRVGLPGGDERVLYRRLPVPGLLALRLPMLLPACPPRPELALPLLDVERDAVGEWLQRVAVDNQARYRALGAVVVRLERDVDPQRRLAGAVAQVANQRFPQARRRLVELGLGRVDRQVGLDRPVRPVFQIGQGNPGTRLELGRLYHDAGGRV